MVVSLHFVVEDLALAGSAGRDEMFVQNVQDVLADVPQLLLNLNTAGLQRRSIEK